MNFFLPLNNVNFRHVCSFWTSSFFFNRMGLSHCRIVFFIYRLLSNKPLVDDHLWDTCKWWLDKSNRFQFKLQQSLYDTWQGVPNMAYVYITEASHPENTMMHNLRYYIILNFIKTYCMVLDKGNNNTHI